MCVEWSREYAPRDDRSYRHFLFHGRSSELSFEARARTTTDRMDRMERTCLLPLHPPLIRSMRVLSPPLRFSSTSLSSSFRTSEKRTNDDRIPADLSVRSIVCARVHFVESCVKLGLGTFNSSNKLVCIRKVEQRAHFIRISAVTAWIPHDFFLLFYQYKLCFVWVFMGEHFIKKI